MVVMETWLNDEDYKAAEERGDIFIPEKDSNNDDVKVFSLSHFQDGIVCL